MLSNIQQNKSVISLDQKKGEEDDEDQNEFKEDMIQDDEGQAVACVESGELIFEDDESDNEDRREEQDDTDNDADRNIQQVVLLFSFCKN